MSALATLLRHRRVARRLHQVERGRCDQPVDVAADPRPDHQAVRSARPEHAGGAGERGVLQGRVGATVRCERHARRDVHRRRRRDSRPHRSCPRRRRCRPRRRVSIRPSSCPTRAGDSRRSRSCRRRVRSTSSCRVSTRQSLGDIAAGLHSDAVQLQLPKFTTTSTLDLNDPLKAMGMGDAFGRPGRLLGAELDPAAGRSRSIQRVYLKVAEKGTEAAAATGIAMSRGRCVPSGLDHARPSVPVPHPRHQDRRDPVRLRGAAPDRVTPDPTSRLRCFGIG